MDGLDEESRCDEMIALESILDPSSFKLYDGELQSGQIQVNLALPEPFYLTLTKPEDVKGLNENENTDEASGTTNNKAGNKTSNEEMESRASRFSKVSVKYLPPLILHFTLPSNYPSEEKPSYTLTSSWLDRRSLSQLCRKLDQLWEDNRGTANLFLWYSILKEEGIQVLEIQDSYDISWWFSPTQSGKLGDKKSIAKTSDTSLKNAKKQSSNDSVSGENGASSSQPKKRRSLRSKSNVDVSHSRRTNVSAIRSNVLDKRAVFDWREKERSLVEYLVSYDQEQRATEFQTRSHSCLICLMEKMGNECTQFSCDHVFCQDCVKAFFTTHIKEGSIGSIKCPYPECKSVPIPNQIRFAVGEELFERYDELLLMRTLESMSDIMYCPRPQCLYPVMCDPNDKLAICSKCNYTFCSSCKMVFHGVEPCRFKFDDRNQLFKKYMDADEEEKKIMEKTYGKNQLKLLVQTVLSEEWVNSRSKPCPHCNAPIEKFEGCNKVACFKCNTYFCWICSAQLDHSNPYLHFNDPSSKCYNNLFMDVDDSDDSDDGWMEESDEEEEEYDSSEFDPPEEEEHQ